MSTKMTDTEVTEMLAKLSSHFGEPVKPVREYCAALRLYQNALNERAERTKEKHDIDSAARVNMVFLDISKSNLLARLIYDSESVRTEMCPVHKGRWSGCVWNDEPCACQGMQSGGHGINVTGWLP